MPHLRQKDHDGQSVDEAQHDRERHHADELAQLQQAESDLQQPHQHHGGKQIFHAMLHHQRHHDHRQCTGGAGNHAGPATECGGDQAHDEGGVEAGERVDLRHEGEGDGLGHQSQGHGQAAEGAEFDAGKGEIGAAVRGHAISNGNIHSQLASGGLKAVLRGSCRNVLAGQG